MAQTYSLEELSYNAAYETGVLYDLQTKAVLNAVYDSNTNTSDWTFDIYARKMGVGENNGHYVETLPPDTTGTWKLNLKFERNSYTNSSYWITTNGEVNDSVVTLNLSNLSTTFTKIHSFTINNIVHNSQGNFGQSGFTFSFYPASTSSPYYEWDSAYNHQSELDIYGTVWFNADTYEINTLAVPNGDIGSTITVSVIKPTNKSLSNIYYSFDYGDTLYRIGDALTTATKINWTIPDAFYAEIPNAKQGYIELYIDTFEEDGVTQVGDRQVSRIIAYTVEADCNPVLAPVITDTNSVTVGLTGDEHKLIRHKSLVNYVANAQARKHATLTSIRVQNGAKTLTGGTNSFGTVTDKNFVFLVTDSRGYTTRLLVTPEMVEYINLSMLVEVEPPTADGYMSFVIKGDYFKGNFGTAENTFVCKYRIKEKQGEFSEWIDVDSNLSATNHYATVNLRDMNYLSYYTLEVYVEDTFDRVDSGSISVVTLPIFDWGINDFAMNVDMAVYGKLTVNGDLDVTGEINGVAGSGSSGGGLHFGDCPTASSQSAKLVTCSTFTELEVGQCIRVQFDFGNIANSCTMNVNGTGAITMKKSTNNFNMNGAWVDGEIKDFVYDGSYWVIVNGGTNANEGEITVNATDGFWFPEFVTESAIDAESVDSNGWYMKTGNVITVGFNITATGLAGYHTVPIEITGLPAVPFYSGSGGGIMNDTVVSWTAANNKLKGSACYPEGAFTCSGTICYFAN